jgi:hypothetical protein
MKKSKTIRYPHCTAPRDGMLKAAQLKGIDGPYRLAIFSIQGMKTRLIISKKDIPAIDCQRRHGGELSTP